MRLLNIYLFSNYLVRSILKVYLIESIISGIPALTCQDQDESNSYRKTLQLQDFLVLEEEPTTLPIISDNVPTEEPVQFIKLIDLISKKPALSFELTSQLSLAPSASPSASPSIESGSPTNIPTKPQTSISTDFFSREPSFTPTYQPSIEPSTTPTITQPTIPTNYPTFSPNYEYPENWFNYDTSDDATYGTKNWYKLDVSTSRSTSSSWNKFAAYDGDNIYLSYIDDDSNECGSDSIQSPINIVPNKKCTDDHTPGRNRGKNKFADLKFEILPSNLRVTLGDPDTAGKLDWSNLSPAIPAIFVNVKIPSEHYIDGKQYIGEFQIYQHFDKGRGRFVVTSILMDYTDDKENTHLEQFIREWEEVARKTKNNCDRRHNPTIPLYTRKYPILTKEEMEEVWGKADTKSKSDYDIFRFMTTGWYCGYEGSITEPPCSRRVYWRVLDLPMKISVDQYERIKRLIVGRLNNDCQPESAHYQGRVNRPLQYRDDVSCCTSSDWSYRVDKDPMHWFESWPIDYHGWKNIDQLRTNNDWRSALLRYNNNNAH